MLFTFLSPIPSLLLDIVFLCLAYKIRRTHPRVFVLVWAGTILRLVLISINFWHAYNNYRLMATIDHYSPTFFTEALPYIFVCGSALSYALQGFAIFADRSTTTIRSQANSIETSN